MKLPMEKKPGGLLRNLHAVWWDNVGTSGSASQLTSRWSPAKPRLAKGGGTGAEISASQ